MKRIAVYFALSFFLLGPLLLPAQTAHHFQRKGDEQYKNSKYREAEEAYRQAEKRKWEDPEINYNLGNAVYRQGHYDASEKLFQQSAVQTKDSALKADALHNLGNSLLLQHKYREAVDAYQNSLRLRPGEAETKANLQLAKKKLKQQQEQEKSNPNPQQQPQNQPNQNPNQQPKPNQQQPQQQPQQQQNPSQQPQQQNQQNQQEQEQQSDGKLTREQARRLLETAVGPADQKNARKYRELDPGRHQPRPGKDW